MTLTERLRAAIQPSECLTSVVSNDLLSEAANQIEHAVIPNMRRETMETETKFTPGPWIAREDTNAILGEDWMIGRPNGKPDEVAVCSKRDARLIAAAPELFEALSVLLEEKVDYMRRNKLGDPEIEGATILARAALAAARGTKE